MTNTTKDRPASTKRRNGGLTRWVLSIVVFLFAAVLVVVSGIYVSQSQRFKVTPAAAPEPATPLLRPATGSDEEPDMSAVAAAAKHPELGKLSAEITDLSTGDTLFSHDPTRMMVPASSTKVYTSAAALLSLQRTDRVPTSVVEGAPGELILVGEGDVTLSRTQGKGFFTDAASVEQLAQQVKEALGDKLKGIKKITVDNSARDGSLFHSSWDHGDISGGNVASLDSVMLDAGRIDPSNSYSPRSRTPAQDVGKALAEQLGLSKDTKVSVTNQTDAPPHPTADQALGQVHSAPLATRVRDMMLHSDNLLAEAVGREVAANQGEESTFEGATTAILKVLETHGVDTEGAKLHDASGMSEDNRLSARNLDSALSNNELHELLQDLPTAHAEGTLLTRYGQGSGAEEAAGWVRAKTGTLSGVNALAGTVTTKSGRPVSFAFLSNGADVTAGREALDRLVAAVYRL